MQSIAGKSRTCAESKCVEARALFGVMLLAASSISCGNKEVQPRPLVSKNRETPRDNEQAREDERRIDLVDVRISLSSYENGPRQTQFSVDVVCDDVYGGRNDWSKTVRDVREAISVVANKSCFFTLNSFVYGNSLFLPVKKALAFKIFPDGSIKSGTAIAYRSASQPDLIIWLSPIVPGPFSLILAYGGEGKRASGGWRDGHRPTPALLDPGSILPMTSVPLAIARLPAPVVNSLKLYIEDGVNGAQISYTMVARISGATGCKYIDNSNNAYDPTTWASVDSGYQNPAAKACPSFDPTDPNFVSNNWDSLWNTGQKILIIWVNTLNGLNAYSSANVGP